ncbi:MAG: RNA-binding transcriptional accessory protein [Clostridia bacterium]|nr:RNA-binding transcriptional accessory protein [Clostridia bacterium]
MAICEKIREEFNLTAQHTDNILKLLDEGNTIPFIARYRKEMTGAIDDQVLRAVNDRYDYLKGLEKRKEEVRTNIEGQGKLTESLVVDIEAAQTLTEVEDIYRPFKQKKKTRASVAIEKGLTPLAEYIMEQEGDPYREALKFLNPDLGVNTLEDAILGAKDIVAELISDNAALRKRLRTMMEEHGELQVKLVKDDERGTYAMYAEYSELIPDVKEHRVLAINRGENEGCLKVRIDFDASFAKRLICAKYIKKGGNRTCAQLLEEAASDGYDRLIEPSIEREVRASLTDKASEQAIKMFEVNLKPLLLQPPVKGKITMGIDPGYRTGCKVAVVDETGKVLDTAVIYPTKPREDIPGSTKTIKELIARNRVDIISIGNGTASKETELFIANLLKTISRDVKYAVVNEAGASVYSASPLAVEEFPDYDLTLRSAISIARRLQDPLSELIKIDPKSIGVGQYQHDVDQKRLSIVLGGVIEDCVNSVGVDLNTASASLLRYVSGLNAGVAKNIVAYRDENGKFKSRSELMKVSKLGAKAFEQSAGFLRIPEGKNILDNTAVHPESYDKAEKLLRLFGYTDDDVKERRIGDLPAKVKALGEERCAAYCGLDLPTMQDIITELIKPGRDIRDTLPPVQLRSDILGIEDLQEGMVLDGVVRNVVDFGAFIDIGVHQDGLVHVSEISDKYITHPSQVLKVGQQVKVMIISLDKVKKRIGLSIKKVKQS